MGNVERNYSLDLRATGRRSQPNTSQRWLLPELPRRQTNAESQKPTFNSANCPDHTDIPYEETSFQNVRKDAQPAVFQHGATHNINDPLTSHGKNLMQGEDTLSDTPTQSTENVLVPWSSSGSNKDITRLKRKKTNFGPVHICISRTSRTDAPFSSLGLLLISRGRSHVNSKRSFWDITRANSPSLVTLNGRKTRSHVNSKRTTAPSKLLQDRSQNISLSDYGKSEGGKSVSDDEDGGRRKCASYGFITGDPMPENFIAP
nr:kinesin-like protein KIN-8A isoform X2 [Ipomoea batatas]